MQIFDKYYRVLGLPVGASDAQVKTAFRKLAKRYHPDISGDTATRGKFIDVNEAYEILMKRDAYVRDAILRYQKKQVVEREKYRKYGKSRGAPSPRERAESYADMKFKRFEKSPIYRTAVVINSVFDYVIFTLGILMIASPFISYFGNSDVPLLPGEEREFQFLPIVLGLVFLYGMWYFLIKHKNV